jgi:hypothetical protein
MEPGSALERNRSGYAFETATINPAKQELAHRSIAHEEVFQLGFELSTMAISSLLRPQDPTDHNQARRRRRNEALWQAGGMACGVLGLDQANDEDPSGLSIKSALSAMAFQFLNLADRKHIPVMFRLKKAPSWDLRGLFAILRECLDVQSDQVFGSLDEPERTEALRLLAKQIGDRYEDRQP